MSETNKEKAKGIRVAPCCPCGYVFNRHDAMLATKASVQRGDTDWHLLCPQCKETTVRKNVLPDTRRKKEFYNESLAVPYQEKEEEMEETTQ